MVLQSPAIRPALICAAWLAVVVGLLGAPLIIGGVS